MLKVFGFILEFKSNNIRIIGLCKGLCLKLNNRKKYKLFK